TRRLDGRGGGTDDRQVSRQQRRYLAGHDGDILWTHPAHRLQQGQAPVALRCFSGSSFQQLLGEQAGLTQFYTRRTCTVSINDALRLLAPCVQGTIGIDSHASSPSCAT